MKFNKNLIPLNIHNSTGISDRKIGFWGATGIGVGAMIGGGILALAGVAFSVSGPSAILAFALNGVIAFLTVFSFAEMAAAHPQNGGVYTFAKKAFSVQMAFGVGWIVWFASIVATVLYALGFGAFFVIAVQQISPGVIENGLGLRWSTAVMALVALGLYGWRLSRTSGGGGMLANIGKLVVFAILIAGGLAMMVKTPVSHVGESFRPFFAGGFSGLIAAMGYTFIALQGFGLITNASGEIREPEKTIPRAMFATVFIGLLVYIPLLFVVSTVGVPSGESITAMSQADPESVVAIAAQNYLGPFGFWLVIVAGIFSMLSALEANIFAASRIALVMARDRTLNHNLSHIDKKTGIPVTAVWVTCALIGALILLVPNVGAAGAASGLIFLVTYALAHAISMLMRKRSFESTKRFRTPLYPIIPIVGMIACLSLAGFQAFVEPTAGIIALAWLIAGMAMFILFFVQKALVVDASEEALDPELVRLRGLSPLVLVPVLNPANAGSKIFLANSLAPPQVGRSLLLSIVIPADRHEETLKRLENNQKAVHQALKASFESGLKPDTLTTIAPEPWEEIARVAGVHRCQSLLLGLSNFDDDHTADNLEQLMQSVACDVVVFRQPYSGWNITSAKRILVPVGGFSEHDMLRARVLASLWRAGQPEITFVQILPEDTDMSLRQKNRRKLQTFAGRIVPGKVQCKVLADKNPAEKITELTKAYDLVIMGLGKPGAGRRSFGEIPLKMARETDTALIFISHK